MEIGMKKTLNLDLHTISLSTIFLFERIIDHHNVNRHLLVLHLQWLSIFHYSIAVLL